MTLTDKSNDVLVRRLLKICNRLVWPIAMRVYHDPATQVFFKNEAGRLMATFKLLPDGPQRKEIGRQLACMAALCCFLGKMVEDSNASVIQRKQSEIQRRPSARH